MQSHCWAEPQCCTSRQWRWSPTRWCPTSGCVQRRQWRRSNSATGGSHLPTICGCSSWGRSSALHHWALLHRHWNRCGRLGWRMLTRLSEQYSVKRRKLLCTHPAALVSGHDASHNQLRNSVGRPDGYVSSWAKPHRGRSRPIGLSRTRQAHHPDTQFPPLFPGPPAVAPPLHETARPNHRCRLRRTGSARPAGVSGARSKLLCPLGAASWSYLDLQRNCAQTLVSSANRSLVHREAAHVCRKLVRKHIPRSSLPLLLPLEIVDHLPAAVDVVESGEDQQHDEHDDENTAAPRVAHAALIRAARHPTRAAQPGGCRYAARSPPGARDKCASPRPQFTTASLPSPHPPPADHPPRSQRCLLVTDPALEGADGLVGKRVSPASRCGPRARRGRASVAAPCDNS